MVQMTSCRIMERAQKLGLLALLGASPFVVTQSWSAPVREFADTTYVTKATRLWTEPTKYGEAIASLDPGLELSVVTYSTTNSWMRVITPGGREGWVPVRHTAMEGRRDKPLAKGQPGETSVVDENGNMRNPASLPIESIATAASAELAKTPWVADVGVGYVNQINRSQASGFGANLEVLKNLSPTSSAGLAFDYNYFSESAADLVANANTDRKTHRIVPGFAYQYHRGDLSLAFGVGVDIDHTSFDSRDLTTGEPIVGTALGLATGSQTSYALALKINPRYRISLSASASFALEMIYDIDIDFSNGSGPFAGIPQSRATHILGAGLSFSQGF